MPIGTEKQKRQGGRGRQAPGLSERGFGYNDALLKTVSEDEFKNELIKALKLYRWRVHHCRPARAPSGKWSTPIQGHSGFPDIVAVRDRVLWVELKKIGEYLKPEQKLWRDAIVGTGAEYYLWRPSDWDEIGRVIR